MGCKDKWGDHHSCNSCSSYQSQYYTCKYYPDYMDGVNAPGWHLHFFSEDKKCGGHVFDISLTRGDAAFCRITSIEIQIPDTPAFDTYALKGASKDEIKSVEQGKKTVSNIKNQLI